MMDQISTTSETLFKRQVNPSVEGQMRPQSREDSNQTERANERAALRAAQHERVKSRSAQQQQTNDVRRESYSSSKPARSETSQAAEMAERLAKSIKESRQEVSRDLRHAGFSHSSKTRQISQTYQQDLPTRESRIIDEIV